MKSGSGHSLAHDQLPPAQLAVQVGTQAALSNRDNSEQRRPSDTSPAPAGLETRPSRLVTVLVYGPATERRRVGVGDGETDAI